MRWFEIDWQEVQERKKKYTLKRIEIVRLKSPIKGLKPGTKGTVISVGDLGILHCAFDNGVISPISIDDDRIILI